MRRWSTAIASAVAALVVVTFGVGRPARAASAAEGCAGPSVTPAQVVACLHDGVVDLHDVEITGTLDLRPIGTVSTPVRCQRCRIDGDLVVTGVTFAHAVELDDVVVSGSVRGTDARFADVVLVRSTRADGAAVHGDLVLDRADFADLASFDGLTIQGQASLPGARFARAASFRGAQFDGALDLEQVNVAGSLLLSGDRPSTIGGASATASGPVSMRAAQFGGIVDLRDRVFHGDVDGQGATFGASALFSTAFLADLDLAGSTFADLDAHSASVEGALTLRNVTATSINLGHANVGALDMASASIAKQAQLKGLDVTDAVNVEDLRAGSLSMDIDLLAHARSRTALLASYTQVESTARSAGDSRLANEAHYRRLALAGRQGSWLHTATDFVFYRGVFGYLVRPLHPATTLLILVVLATLARLWFDRSEAAHAPTRPGPRVDRTPRRSVRVGRVVSGVFSRFSRSLGAALRPKPSIPSPAGQNHFTPYLVAAGRWSEFLAGKVLLFLFVVCLGNANATLHDLFQALKG